MFGARVSTSRIRAFMLSAKKRLPRPAMTGCTRNLNSSTTIEVTSADPGFDTSRKAGQVRRVIGAFGARRAIQHVASATFGARRAARYVVAIARST